MVAHLAPSRCTSVGNNCLVPIVLMFFKTFHSQGYIKPGNGRGMGPRLPKISHLRLFVGLLAWKVNCPDTVSFFLATQWSTSLGSQSAIVTEMILPPVEPRVQRNTFQLFRHWIHGRPQTFFQKGENFPGGGG